MISRIVLSLFLFCSTFSKSQHLYCEASMLRFAEPDIGTYLETILSIDGSTLVSIEKSPGSFERGVNIGILIFDKRNDKIAFADKYKLMAQATSDSVFTYALLDVRRIPLENGNYEISIFISDINRPSDTLKTVIQQNILYKTTQTFLSDVMFIESIKPATSASPFSKSGYDMVPKTGNFFPHKVSSLKFYTEVVFGEPFLNIPDKNVVISFYIENADTEKPVNNYSAFKKDEIRRVNVLYREFDISKLPSGNYNLIITVKNRKNEVLASNSTFFQRSNPLSDLEIVPDSTQTESFDFEKNLIESTFADTFTNVSLLADCIKSLYPISTNSERVFQNNQLNLGNLELMKKYFYKFWIARNKSNPSEAWEIYLGKVKTVVKNYSTQIQRGYETDRGRVYLQYGEPNTMDIRRFEPNSYPYEIWHYYKINNTLVTRQQSNKKFVFYTNDRSTNDYQLLHSTAIGEKYDDRWQMKLNSRSDQSRNLDDTQPIDERGPGINSRYGSRMNDDFKTPY